MFAGSTPFSKIFIIKASKIVVLPAPGTAEIAIEPVLYSKTGFWSSRGVILKRGLSSTIEEWLLSAEHIMAGGNENVILCERGIRTFETYTRNTLDLSAVPVVKKHSHLPIIVDPSHGTGSSDYVESMAKAAIVSGCDGLMIEVHNNPQKALSDGQQSITPEQFDKLMKKIKILSSLED